MPRLSWCRRGRGEERDEGCSGARRAPAGPTCFRWMASAGHEPTSNQDGKRCWDHACTTRSDALCPSLSSSLARPPLLLRVLSTADLIPRSLLPHLGIFSLGFFLNSLSFISSALLSSLLCDWYYRAQEFDDASVLLLNIRIIGLH